MTEPWNLTEPQRRQIREAQAAAKAAQPSRPVRRGRWTFNPSSQYGVGGWHLDGTPVVLDFMPGAPPECPHGTRRCRGEYQLHGWPGREWESVACSLRRAMEVIEREWDKAHGPAWDGACAQMLRAGAAGESGKQG